MEDRGSTSGDLPSSILSRFSVLAPLFSVLCSLLFGGASVRIELNRASAQPLYMQLAQDIQRRIRSGALPPGARLPTVRELARQLGVTRLTIHSAYSELQSGGWVEATVGRGTFVADSLASVSALAQPNGELSAHTLMSDMLRMAQLPGLRSLAMADPAHELYPMRDFKNALDEALSSGGPAILGYATSQGDPLLRTTLADHLRDRGVHAAPDEILITSGASQAMALICQTLARPGDTVIVEQPTYLGVLNTLNAQGVRAVGAPLDEDGLVVDALEPLILAQRPRFIYTIPVFQNPTGVCLSPARRVALLELAARHRIPLVEDDIYGRLAYDGEPPPALKADDQDGLVIHIGSFSKSLLPGVRVGYIAAAPELIARLVVSKQANDLCSPLLLQRTLALFLQHGRMAAHLRRVIPRYRERRDALLGAMSRCFPSGLRWTAPHGGFCSWVALPPGISTTELYLAAIERGVAFAPGDMFFSGPAPRPYVRLAFATQPPDVIHEAIQILSDVLGTHLTRRSFKAPAIGDYVPLV
jgi:DNA-binding transcriptional MocR family regulator